MDLVVYLFTRDIVHKDINSGEHHGYSETNGVIIPGKRRCHGMICNATRVEEDKRKLYWIYRLKETDCLEDRKPVIRSSETIIETV